MPRSLYICLGIIACCVALCTPASAQAIDAGELYWRALARLHALAQQPFIEYTMSQENNAPDGSPGFSLTEIVIERRADRTSWNAVTGGDSLPLNHVLIGRHYLVPDAFLRAGSSDTGPVATTVENGAGALPQLDDAEQAPSPLKIIATVTNKASRRYTVTGNREESVPNCGNAVHVFLHPTGDPEFNNVRELWIRANDAMLCEARYNSKLFDVRHTQTANTLDVTATLNEDGLVTSYHSIGHVFLPAPGYTSTGDGTFTNVVWKTVEPDYLFDEKLWNAHANQVKASLKATPSPKPRTYF